jgi:hypothetical protein
MGIMLGMSISRVKDVFRTIVADSHGWRAEAARNSA